MTLTYIRVAGCLCALFLMSAPAMAGGWEHDYETALNRARARASERPLLIHFHADWCGPCRSMERNVLNTAEVLSALTTNIVGVKVKSDVRRDLVRRYKIRTLPSDVIISPDGKAVHRTSGAASRSGYVATLKRFGRSSHGSMSTSVAPSL